MRDIATISTNETNTTTLKINTWCIESNSNGVLRSIIVWFQKRLTRWFVTHNKSNVDALCMNIPIYFIYQLISVVQNNIKPSFVESKLIQVNILSWIIFYTSNSFIVDLFVTTSRPLSIVL